MIVVTFNTTFNRLRNVYNIFYLYVYMVERIRHKFETPLFGSIANEMDLGLDNIV